MSEKYLKTLVIGFWVLLFIFLALLVWFNTPVTPENLRVPIFWLNYFVRLSALLAFVLMADQIFTGAFLDRITTKLGGWFFHYHIIQGAIAYALIIAHPFLYFVFLSVARNTINPFYIYTEFCVICTTQSELFITLGRIAFWLSLVTAFAAIFRVKIYQLRPYWRYIHILNYVIFILIAIHAKFKGTDVMGTPFKWIYFAAVGLVLFTTIYKLLLYFKTNFRLK